MITVDTSPFVEATGKEPRGARLYVFRAEADGRSAKFNTDGNYSESLAKAKTAIRKHLRRRDFTIELHPW
jgi:hypothetical protein